MLHPCTYIDSHSSERKRLLCPVTHRIRRRELELMAVTSRSVVGGRLNRALESLLLNGLLSTSARVQELTSVTGRDPLETGRDPPGTSRDPSDTGLDPSETSRDPSDTGPDPSGTSRDPSETGCDPLGTWHEQWRDMASEHRTPGTGQCATLPAGKGPEDPRWERTRAPGPSSAVWASGFRSSAPCLQQYTAAARPRPRCACFSAPSWCVSCGSSGG